jgi:hypothetical protein
MLPGIDLALHCLNEAAAWQVLSITDSQTVIAYFPILYNWLRLNKCYICWYCGSHSQHPSKNSVEDRGQRECGSGGGSPLVSGSAQFVNEWNPCAYYVTDVFSIEQVIRLGFFKTLEFRGVEPLNPPPPLGAPLHLATHDLSVEW